MVADVDHRTLLTEAMQPLRNKIKVVVKGTGFSSCD